MKSCPQCHLLLEDVAAEDIPIAVCRSCGGVWAAASAADRLLADRERLDGLNTAYPSDISAGVFEGLRMTCPDCRLVALEAEPVADAPDVQILRCPKCRGAWLAAGQRAALAARRTAQTDTQSVVEEPATLPPADVTQAADAPSAHEPGIDESAIRQPLSQAPGRPETEPEIEAVPEPAIAAAPEPPAAPEPSTVFELPAPPASEDLSRRPGESNADRAIRLLLEGNARFAAGRSLHPRQDPSRRAEVAQAQDPIAVVLGCVDSRVSPEIIFDQGLGDLFVTRTAGNTVDPSVAAALEFALSELHVSLVIVLGHTGCGAVQAAMNGSTSLPQLGRVMEAIRPAVERARSLPGNPFENAVRVNTLQATAQATAASSYVAERVASGEARLVAACYDIVSGRVTLLDTPELPAELDAAPEPEPAPAAADPWSLTGQPTPVPPAGDAPAQEEQTLTCPRCLTVYPAAQRVCERCGVELVTPGLRVPCPQCGSAVHFALDRCLACGGALRTRGWLDEYFPVIGVEADAAHTHTWRQALAPTMVFSSPAAAVTARTAAEPSAPPTAWCPQCRKGFGEGATYCDACGKPLVNGSYRVVCFRCLSENTIAADVCWSCHAPLHKMDGGPMHMTVDAAPPPPFAPRQRPPVQANATGCSTYLVAGLLLAGAIAAILLR